MQRSPLGQRIFPQEPDEQHHPTERDDGTGPAVIGADAPGRDLGGDARRAARVDLESRLKAAVELPELGGTSNAIDDAPVFPGLGPATAWMMKSRVEPQPQESV